MIHFIKNTMLSNSCSVEQTTFYLSSLFIQRWLIATSSYFCAIFQNFLLTLFFLFFILSLTSHLQQNKQCLSAYVGSNLAVPMLSETSGCYVYCFFVQYIMLYFAGANIIIKGEKTVCRLFQCFMVLLLRCTTTVNTIRLIPCIISRILCYLQS